MKRFDSEIFARVRAMATAAMVRGDGGPIPRAVAEQLVDAWPGLIATAIAVQGLAADPCVAGLSEVGGSRRAGADRHQLLTLKSSVRAAAVEARDAATPTIPDDRGSVDGT